MKDTYIINVDMVCCYCGYRNQIYSQTLSQVEVIACGNCGEFIMLPDDISAEDKKIAAAFVSRTIKGDV